MLSVIWDGVICGMVSVMCDGECDVCGVMV